MCQDPVQTLRPVDDLTGKDKNIGCLSSTVRDFWQRQQKKNKKKTKTCLDGMKNSAETVQDTVGRAQHKARDETAPSSFTNAPTDTSTA